jgi:hypothetical protein
MLQFRNGLSQIHSRSLSSELYPASQDLTELSGSAGILGSSREDYRYLGVFT